MDENWTRYSPVSGYPELRQAIVNKLKNENGLDYDISNIVVSTGAKQSLSNVLLTLVNPGDEVNHSYTILGFLFRNGRPSRRKVCIY
ncbi:Aspartate aminotransferase [Sphingobacterium daejeonense]|nr:Aspartate aminotransferase [Sphingobacterium daejeonense]